MSFRNNSSKGRTEIHNDVLHIISTVFLTTTSYMYLPTVTYKVNGGMKYKPE